MSPNPSRFPLGAGLILLAASAAHAADAPQVYSLSPADRAAAIDDAASGRTGLGAGGDRQIHGEFGVTVGTGGARSVYGVAQIPLGDNAGATVAFEDSRWGSRRYR